MSSYYLFLFLILSVDFVSAKSYGKWVLMSDDGGHDVHLVNLNQETTSRSESDIKGNVTIFLSTSTSQTSPYPLTCENTGSFNEDWPTAVLVHGWKSESSDLDHIKEAYLAVGDYNIISVDWSPIAENLNYVQVTEDLVVVGQYVAELLDCMVDTKGLDMSKVHLIGHSLGAHVVGVIGGSVKNIVSLITGLDPAGPNYKEEDNPSKDKMLDIEDAEFVQIIHTNTALLGLPDVMGHADFYPNGGSKQAGCGGDYFGSCSHGRSTLYFAESISSRTEFMGFKCDNWETYSTCYGQERGVMGANIDTSSVRGVYYMKTATSAPFALGIYG